MLNAAKAPGTRVLRVDRQEDALVLETGGGKLKLEPKTAEIVRGVYTVSGEFSSTVKPGIVFSGGFSGWRHSLQGNEVVLETDALLLRVNMETASICYYRSDGTVLLREREYESRVMECYDTFILSNDAHSIVEKVQTADGEKTIVRDAAKEPGKSLHRSRLYLHWQDGEALYGLGQHEEGDLNLRGKTVYLHQANMKIAIPMLVSSLGYGILADTYAPMVFNDTEFGAYLYNEADEEMDHYLVYGGDMNGVVSGYRRLTGKAAMLPKWAFGYICSQERYETAEELVRIVDEHRSREIGLDCIVLDWDSWRPGDWGQKTLDKARFPDPDGLLQALHDRDARFMVSVWPGMDEKSDNYKEFAENKLLMPQSNLYDPLKEAGRQLYWKQANEGLFCHGVDAWWCDSSEPFTPEWNYAMKPEAASMFREYVDTAGQYLPANMTNAYTLFHSQTMCEGQRSVTSEKRAMILTRSGYTGQQRYGAVLWSGDTAASWNTYKKQIAAGLNFCASGLPYWTTDVGAFFVKKSVHWYWSGAYDGCADDLGYRELYVRWYQYACFLPVFRTHGTDLRRELWNFGKPGEPFYDALLQTNRLRYQLLPYIYSAAGHVWKDDQSMMRMLAFDFAHDEKVLDIKDQYMFGESLMVCPVTEAMFYEYNSKPLPEKAAVRKVYLPRGASWYDFWTGAQYSGGQIITTSAPLHVIPLFVKAGSIVPVGPVVQYTGQPTQTPVQLRVYPGEDVLYELYDDEGDSYRYASVVVEIENTFGMTPRDNCI